jgi:hypothetical protein
MRYGAFSWNEMIKLQVQRKGRDRSVQPPFNIHRRACADCAVPIQLQAESPSLNPPQTQDGCLALSAEEIAAAPPRPS